MAYPLTIFYDASCALCASEMAALKARDAAGRLELVDCAAPDFDASVLAGTALRREDLMRLIHARDAQGRWLVGVEVFARAYAAAGLKGLARFWGSPVLRPLLVRVYPWIARHRQPLSGLGMDKVLRFVLPVPCESGGSCRIANPRRP